MVTLTSGLDYNDVAEYFVTCSIPNQQVTQEITQGFTGQCYNTEASVPAALTLQNISESLFTTLKFKFDTYNQRLLIPASYYQSFGQINRLNQNYVIEVFKIPGAPDSSYALFDEINIVDLTLNELADGYDKQDVLEILTYFKDVANARASRRASVTSGYYGVSGGSRINYRYNLAWSPSVKNSNNQVSSLELIN
jgi:hypothetical protein